MIDNFAPQPFPLECTYTGEYWSLVLGWQRTGDGQLVPLIAPDGEAAFFASNPSQLRFRLADTRPTVGRAAARQAQQYLGIPSGTVYSWASRGGLRSLDHDQMGRPLYDVGDLLRLRQGEQT